MTEKRKVEHRLMPGGDAVKSFGDVPETNDTETCSDVVKRNVLAVLEMEDVKQAELAKVLGWSRAQLAKVLKSDRPIRVDEVMELAWALSVAPASLMTPWSEDVVLRVRLGGKKLRLELGAAETFRWVAGILPPPLTQTDHGRYMRLMPPGVRQRPEELAALREAHGVRLTDHGIEWLTDDGTVALIETEGHL